jgi:hypothetical protein
MSGPNPLLILLHLTFSPPLFLRGLLPTVILSRASPHSSSRMPHSIFTVPSYPCLSVPSPFLYTVSTYRAHPCTPQRQSFTLNSTALRLHCPVPVPTPPLVSSTLYSLFHAYPSSLLFSTQFLNLVPTLALLNANPPFILSSAHLSSLLFSTQLLHPVPTPALLNANLFLSCPVRIRPYFFSQHNFFIPCPPLHSSEPSFFLKSLAHPFYLVQWLQFHNFVPSPILLYSIPLFMSEFLVTYFSEKLENNYRKNTDLDNKGISFVKTLLQMLLSFRITFVKNGTVSCRHIVSDIKCEDGFIGGWQGSLGSPILHSLLTHN